VVNLNLCLLSRISLLCARKRDTLLNETHLSCEGRVRNPFAGIARVDFFKHAVHLFEGQALGLGDQEVGERYADDAERTPHEEDLGGKVGVLLIYQVWGNDGDNLRHELVKFW
jgi:hypothetical protein